MLNILHIAEQIQVFTFICVEKSKQRTMRLCHLVPHMQESRLFIRFYLTVHNNDDTSNLIV